VESAYSSKCGCRHREAPPLCGVEGPITLARIVMEPRMPCTFLREVTGGRGWRGKTRAVDVRAGWRIEA
jgi:hypothetical protein